MGSSASKQHARRIARCQQSFQQLQADIRFVNLQCAQEFARPPSELEAAVQAVEAAHAQKGEGAPGGPPPESDLLVLQFRPFTKLAKKSALPWLWRVNDNVIVTATVTPKRVADAAIAAASEASAAGTPPTPSLIDPAHASFTLTIRDFYELYLFLLDHLKEVQSLRHQCLKIERPEEWQRLEDERRAAILAQQRAKESAAGEGEEEEKSAAAIATAQPPVRQLSTFTECSICLTAPDEEGKGQALVVLPCHHSFCESCIEDWKAQSNTCPLCRKELSADMGSQDDEWILTSPDLAQLKAQLEKVIAVPYKFIAARPAFPPADNRRGVKNVGDVFSLAVGEVLDVFAPAPKRKPGATPPVAVPVAEAVTIQR